MKGRRRFPARARRLLGAVLVAGLLPGPRPVLCGEPAPPSVLRGPEACAPCHPNQYQQWRGSMHAYAAIDPIFQACNRKALEDTGGEIGELCVTCHVPLGTRTGEVSGPLELAALSSVARAGVSCEFCHKVDGPLEDHPPANGSLRWSEGNVIGGPLENPRSFPSHESTTREFLSSSEFCGRCHDVLRNGVVLERTYAQWSDSIHRERANECQDCHMARYSGRAAVDGPFRDTLRRHDFAAVSVPLVPFPNRGSQRERVEEILRATARLAVEVPPRVASDGPLPVRVTVKNTGAGHNVPSGFSTKRQMWLEVTVRGEGGAPLFRSGHTDSNGDLLDSHSSIDPEGDPWLVSFSDRFLDARREEVLFVWQAASLQERSLRPLEERSALYRWHVPADLAGSELRIVVRLLYRPFAPYVLRELGLESLVGELPVWEMARFDSGRLPILAELPRRSEYLVPDDFSTIAEALEALRDGDAVRVRPGEYELPGPIDFRGKAIRLSSTAGARATILRRGGSAIEDEGSVVVFRTGEGSGAVLEGFTLTGGRGTRVAGTRRGGAILVVRSSPRIVRNRIVECHAAGGFGGGIAVEGGSPRLEENEILSCQAERGGGVAISSPGARVPIEGGSIQGNVARRGGGLHVERGSRVDVSGCVVAGNIAWEGGGGACLERDAVLEMSRVTLVGNRGGAGPGAIATAGDLGGSGEIPRIRDSVVWENGPGPLEATSRYCLLDPETAASARTVAVEAIAGFPLFVDPGGFWDPRPSPLEGDPADPAPWKMGTWRSGDYRLLPGSPAIDAGDPETAPDPDDSRADVGAIHLEQPLRAFVRGDVDGDGAVTFADLWLLAGSFLGGGDIPCLDAADLDDSAVLEPTDALLLGTYLVTGAPRPADPFPDCGLDSTFGDGLSCQRKAEPCR